MVESKRSTPCRANTESTHPGSRRVSRPIRAIALNLLNLCSFVRTSILDLNRKIISHFEMKKSTLKGLKGLRVSTLKRVQPSQNESGEQDVPQNRTRSSIYNSHIDDTVSRSQDLMIHQQQHHSGMGTSGLLLSVIHGSEDEI